MQLFEGILVMLSMVLISNIMSRFFPNIAIPLIQVVLGFGIALLSFVHSFELESELFMLVFLAPLLFNEGQMVDKKALWKEKKAVLTLSILLVFITVGILGYVIHLLVPLAPWAACFALSAALAPTDAVAVGALAEKVKIPHRMLHTLEGESLINDASGLVSFQFASAALLTGVFSLVDAEVSFVLISLGGVLIGVVSGLLGLWFIRWMKSLGIENNVSYILFELLLPFIVFLMAETLGVNGILAVVSAGLIYSWNYKKINPEVAQLNILSKSTWSIYSFSLNGLVFVLLGTQLPDLAHYVWKTNQINNWTILGYVLIVTTVLLGIRFLCVLVCNNFDGFKGKHDIKKSLLYTVSGVRGTITLVSALSLPTVLSTGDIFIERELLISIAAGVIIVTLLLANFAMPLLADKKEESIETNTEIEVQILRRVTEQLKRKQTEQNTSAIRKVIQLYNERIVSLVNHDEFSEKNKELMELVLVWQLKDTLELVESGEVSLQMVFRRLEVLDRRLFRLTHKPEYSKNSFYKNIIGTHLKFLGTRLTSFDRKKELKIKLKESNRNYVIRMLNQLDTTEFPPELIDFYLTRYEDRDQTVIDMSEDTLDEWLDYAIQLERDYIQKEFEKGKMNRQELTIYRENLSAIESSIQFIA
ncbi:MULTISPECIES: sodium:proton antiporter [Enterococcaceae]|uniref:cation:proton antiporter n=1 Tax=Enterococcaceae TaxID=81852 RepID=UPI000E4B8434|nr:MULTISPECIES: sodium:proton antiporter [Enterococcaceae]MCI0129979.1 sodium:proton antiporter [Vagococcus sp. CY53-2]RGI30848.1 sodium:proton antiporter [Melissococcus sp. OM08-11BH]